MLVKVVTKEALGLMPLLALVLQHIYDNNLSHDEQRQMQDSVVNWGNKLKLDEEMERLEENEQYIFERICKYIDDNDRGRFDERKRLFKRNKIDWRKFHNMPGARTEKDFFIGKQLEEKSRRFNGF